MADDRFTRRRCAALLLLSFVLIELRTRHPELPLHLLRSRRRSGAYLISLLLGTALFAVFFFLTLYVQTIWGYSPIRAGLAWLPFPVVIIVVSTLVARVLMVRVGVRPLILAGPLLASGGFLWLSHLNPHGSYLVNLLPGMLLVSLGMGLLFVPMTVMVVSHLRDEESGAASGLFNVGQQIGGSIGLAAIGTIAWTAVAASVKTQMAAAAAHAAGGAAVQAGSAAAGNAASSASGSLPPTVLANALTHGFSVGLTVASGVIFVGFLVAIVTTWTGSLRLSSAVHEGREEPCDEALGTCEPLIEPALEDVPVA
jgi:predicted MFS family arabinose efflux permease